MTRETDKLFTDYDPKKSLILGTVGAPFGLKGFVKIRSFSGETDHFSRLKKVTLRLGEKDKTLDVAETVVQGDSLLMRFSGIDTPEAAGSLNGAGIIAEREYAAPLKDNEYYVEDLKGLEVVNSEGKSLGTVINIVEGGGGELAELKTLAGELRFVPYRKEFFSDVDMAERKIVLLEPWILE